MLKRVRDVLLTDYIGAIVIAILVADTCRVLLVLVGYPLQFLLLRQPKVSVLVGAVSGSDFDWNVYVEYLVRLAVHLAAVIVLAWWLYGRKEESHPAAEDTSEETA